MGIALASLVLLMLLLEFGTRFAVWLVEPAPRNHLEYRLSRPAPYRDAEYYSREFVLEAVKGPGGWKKPKGTNHLVATDHESKYATYRDGKRHTLFQPTHAEHVVHVFGGSTMVGGEVPDEFTIASQLQGQLNLTFPGRFRVENLGASSVVIRQQLDRLKYSKVEPEDVVVFYDGVNDIIQSIYRADAPGTIVQYNRMLKEQFNFAQRIVFWFHRRWSKSSVFVRRFMDPFGTAVPEHISQPARMRSLGETLKSGYLEAIVEADGWTRSRGARFHHFVQPNLFSHDRLTEYETRLSELSGIVRPGFRESFETGTRALLDASQAARELGISSLDLTGVFDDRQADEEYYLDVCHVNHTANQRIAEAIFAVMTDGGDPASAVAHQIRSGSRAPDRLMPLETAP